MPPPRKSSLPLVCPPQFFQKFLLIIQCFSSKAVQLFFDFVRVAFFILLNAIVMGFI